MFLRGDANVFGVRRERARELLAIAEAKRAAFAASFIGRDVEVLVEKIGADGLARGWTSQYVEARIPGLGPDAVNTIVTFRPTRTGRDKDVFLAAE